MTASANVGMQACTHTSPNSDASGAVTVAFDGAIAVVTLNRPQAYNAIDASVTSGLLWAMRQVEARDDVRVIVLRGAGRGFCAGGDLSYFASASTESPDAVHRMLADGNAAIEILNATPKLVLTSVHGIAAGAGLSLALCGDFCIAAADAAFNPAYVKLGISPDLGGSALMVGKLGLRTAMRAYFLEERITATAAQQMGLVSILAAPPLLEAETMRVARMLAAIPTAAADSTKALLRSAVTSTLKQQLEAEVLSFSALLATPVVQTALQQFVRQTDEPKHQGARHARSNS